ncbi:peptide-methionine (S)-S-oxide reductase MsrA [Cruoricaptor ignavus]|uniref:Peptide methionine sulfoxide reductase MsrA n=1 Tax=Cruoricaptor ignavus TaxID=1118202 RepID=A0A7M1T6Y6_9FLAO|nr:peptide-methionine (S)-S-oxide reductase MsrA [Cruoricaptor ignavus]QOR74864.1 peptide-methionine (S)-S-oxide reductase MsrA [Cruoricaptor ignavus]
MRNIFKFLACFFLISCSGQTEKNLAKPIQNKKVKVGNLKQITFGGGCFWCIEGAFNMLKGVESAVSGYSGGSIPNPTYEEVCTGSTGHAEVVQITYNPQEISYQQLLDVFFFLHDPTQLNRQGNDIGTQYRSVIFYNNEEEKRGAEAEISAIDASGKYAGKVVTEVVPFTEFYPAEDYHQGYYKANPSQPYCSAVVGPKIQKFRKHFQDLGMIED